MTNIFAYIRSHYVRVLILLLISVLLTPLFAIAQSENASAPTNVVKLVFIHHSCGENWLADSNGRLGKAIFPCDQGGCY